MYFLKEKRDFYRIRKEPKKRKVGQVGGIHLIEVFKLKGELRTNCQRGE